MHIAAIHGQLPVLQHLLHKHEDRLTGHNFDQEGPQAVDNKGMVAIHYAVLKNNEEMVRYLIEHKNEEITVGAFRKKKQTDMSVSMAKQLHSADAEVFRANYMNQLREQKASKIKLSQESLVNVCQNDNFTPLHYACHRGNLSILKLLISFGGDITARSKNGVSCLHLACVSGNLDLVKYLIDEHNFDT